ncbi:helix-turn-helix domain-containing protein [Halocatena halophila]|uniref:helix-turn-helix domain-containing protein n=1 Tax=Halocatena halophila TaxID=2814576 RepID=UPI002ED34D74
MREFIFTITYARSADPIMDVFIQYPSLRAQTIACHVSANGQWRLDRIVGPAQALEQVEAIYTDGNHCNECIGPHDCLTEWDHERLLQTPTCRLIYTYSAAANNCWSIPELAHCYLGDGLVCDAARHKNQYEWRLLMPDGARVSELYNGLKSELKSDLSLDFRQVGEPTYWTEEGATVADLPYEQRTAVQAAIDRGYYRTPREISLTDLAAAMDIPMSTLQYRLQRAESWIIQQFVNQPIARHVKM